MPANLTAEAKAKWKEAQAAKAPADKIRALQEFLSLTPKHKGTENLRNQTKRKIAALKLEIAAKKQKRQGIRSSLLTVEKTGHAQIALIGPANGGRSSLLASVTNASPLIAPYRFTTQQLEPGMLLFEDLQLQLVEVPALLDEEQSLAVRPTFADFVRGVDAIVAVLDLSTNPVWDFQRVVRGLDDLRIIFTRPESSVQVVTSVKGGSNQIFVSGELVDCTAEDVLQLLNGYRLKNVLVRTFGRVKLDDIEEAVLENAAIYKPLLVVANKIDLPNAQETAHALTRHIPARVEMITTSCLTGKGLTEFPALLFKSLDIIRVYTREPNESKPSPEPFVVKSGTTTGELAKLIHSQLYEAFRFARIWGSSKFPGERVGASHILHDKDVVEIHA